MVLTDFGRIARGSAGPISLGGTGELTRREDICPAAYAYAIQRAYAYAYMNMTMEICSAYA